MRYFYVYLWYNVFDVNCFIKYGITNNVNKRINEQSKYTTHKPYELFSGGFIEQNIAESIENAIHKFRNANGLKPNENEPKHMKILVDACMLKRVPKDYSFKII